MKDTTSHKKILIFSTAYLPFVGGAEVSIKETSDRLPQYEYHLITARFRSSLPPFERVGNIMVHRIGPGIPLVDKLLLPFFGGYTALRLSLTHSYSLFWVVMISFSGGAAYIANIVRRILRKSWIPIVLTLQEGDSEEHLQYRWAGLLYFSSKLALRYADAVTALSQFLLSRAERLGCTSKTFLVPNGVDINLFSQEVPASKKEKLLAEYTKKPGDIFLITVSRLVRKNAVDDCIRALTFLPQHVHLLVVGVGADRLMLETLVKTLGLSERVHFVGFVSHPDLPAYFAISDVFVRPSRSEGFGNSFIEAMAAGLPVVATPVGGIPDFVDDKETGVFCAPDNPKSVAEAVMYIVDHDHDRAVMVRNAYTRVTERYSWENVAERMNEVFTRYNQ